jgi:phytoene desaturase
MSRVIVIGAGLGGLSAAIRLAYQGHDVTILEKNERVGGKMNIWQAGGYTFDTGPSLLTMPFVVRELFSSVGRQMDDYLQLVPVDPICRYSFSDGSTLNARGDRESMVAALERFSPGSGQEFVAFMEHGKRIYEASSEPFLFSSFGSMGFGDVFRNLRHVPAIAQIDAFRSLHECVREYFSDGRLQQLFDRFATYNGSSPYQAPATLSIIPYIEFAMGGWYVKGGMYKLAEALSTLAIELGVEIRTNAPVERIRLGRSAVEGVVLSGGDEIAADIVVCNADALFAHEQLLPGLEQGRRRYKNVEPSLAGFVMLLGVSRSYPELEHHNIFFSEDYEQEFDTLFREQLPYNDPTVYVGISSISDPSHAADGGSNLFVLVNAPAVGDNYDWETNRLKYRDVVLQKLSRSGLENIESHIDVERVITPVDFAREYNAYRGSIYGTSSNSRMAAFLRPANKSKDVDNLYFVGGSSHPGGGIPLVLLSGKIVSELVAEECAFV